MKPFKSLNEAKKTLIRQVMVLIAAMILLSLAGRVLTGNRFNTQHVLSFDPQQYTSADDIEIKWENESITVTGLTVKKAVETGIKGSILDITLLPDKPGRYEMTITDRDGNNLGYEVIYVDRLLTAMAKSTGNFTGDEAVILSIILFYLGLALIVLLTGRRLKGPLAYSYEAILCGGVFMFSLVALFTEVPVYIRHLINPVFYPTGQLVGDIAAGGKYFVIITMIPVAIFSIMLIISNIALLRHERPRLKNVLGLLLGICMIASEYGFYRFGCSDYIGSEKRLIIYTAVGNVIGIVMTYAECILFSSALCGLRAAKHIPAYDLDYILILGCGFRADGTLFPLLQGRVDRAIGFWKKQKEETGKTAVIIPSGGQGRNEPFSEAQAMYRYMIGTGFPEESIILEDQSANTYQNMAFSKKIIEERHGGMSDVNVAFSTTNYHVFRSGVWAGLAGLKAEGMGSRTRWWFWPNAFVRECIGLLKNRLIPEIVCLVLLVVVFAVITRLAYL